ncbi:putative glycosyltransferase [Vibrio owensii]|uniref:hypothetical protein n=1 Tax=Vibrio owensii TaxID=696485 RepID=UPI0028945744|nr:putative glycosyltransferase [Vibrio owensii]CAH1554824.1 putative glycosyltransferase [Vibrio owensii]
MANFNFIERKVANLLRSNPLIKMYIKNFYQRLAYYLYKKPYKSRSNEKVMIIESSGYESFFGYYDNNPRRGDYELYHITSIPTSIEPLKSLSMEKDCFVIVKSLINDEIVFKAKTLAFNWQQGAKLQWVSDNSFIYNDIIKDSVKSILVNLDTGNKEILDEPVYDAFNNKFYLSLDYRPLSKLRPDYAYFTKSDLGKINFEYQSIKKVHYDGECEIVIDLSSLLEKYPLVFDCDYSKQKFNHIMISKDGSQAIFLHRAYTTSGVRVDRLFSVSLVNDYEVKLISDSGMISHYCWVNDSTILAYMKHNDINGYYFIDLDKVVFTNVNVDELDGYGDGHPTYIGNGKFITDTYPDKSRMKSLLLVDTVNKDIKVLAEFLEPLKYRNQTRCDLHPKWDEFNDYIYFDSVHEGVRALYKIRIGNGL